MEFDQPDISSPNPYIETRILHKLLIPQPIIIDWEKITAEPMGATTIFCFPCEINILYTISRFSAGIWVVHFNAIKPLVL